MKLTAKVMRRNFPECIPNCNCMKNAAPEDELYKVRFHLATPTGPIIQAVDATCDRCGKTAYSDVSRLGLTRDMLIL